MIQRRLFWVYLVVITSLTGCALPTPSEQASSTEVNQRIIDAHQQKLEQLQQWSLSGRMAVIQKQNKERDSFYINWHYQPHQQVIRFSHPLKGQLAKLTVDDSGALLTDSDDQERWAPSADALLYRLLGAAVPFEQLHHWVLGRKTNSLKSVSYHKDGTLAQSAIFHRGQNWQLSWFYDQDKVQTVTLPEQIHLESPDLLIKVQVNEWQ
ncbi:UNVERIFIED_ORG: outer membrane lipoprotein LolB [Idiomarina abyssalis]|uniref:lipoprotein insertase outer membrane protein LolB n=1 Tax=Idiomarina sp. 017G TaxID=2183988 RepID=UPI000C53F47A|nr:lipoprotein insertase outer membrane protein LolB [Idiomarina sp. 017G]MAA62291.1 outer membrane lipoprotein LolB [Idiomarina sp.]TDO53237.1 outer membrane lipoprotein LolB [Idiomarina sp. 017G]